MDKTSLIFCGGSLGICIAIAAIAFPFAALSKAEATAAGAVIDAEELGTMNLGDFGDVAVVRGFGCPLRHAPRTKRLQRGVAVGTSPLEEVAHLVQGEHRDRERERGPDHLSGVGLDVLASLIDHVAPRGLRQLNTQTEEGQRTLDHDDECR